MNFTLRSLKAKPKLVLAMQQKHGPLTAMSLMDKWLHFHMFSLVLFFYYFYCNIFFFFQLMVQIFYVDDFLENNGAFHFHVIGK